MKVISLEKVAEFGGGFAPSATSILKLFLTLPAGETSIVTPQLENATILLLIRSMLPLDEVPADPNSVQYTFDPLTGTLAFSVVNATNEEPVYVLFYPSPSSGITVATEPITMAEARSHLQIDYPDDDVEIYRMIKRCRQRIENYCLISIVATRWALVGSFDCEGDELPYGPVITIETVQSRDPQSSGSGPVQYVNSQNMWHSQGNKFIPAGFGDGDIFINSRWGAPWANNIKIIYTAGMTVVPEDLKLAILAELAYRFEHKGNVAESGICEAATVLAAPYRNMSWI